MIDELRVEIVINGRQVTVGEQSCAELIDDLLVIGAIHPAIVGSRQLLHHPSKVGCFLRQSGRRMAVWNEAARSRGVRMIWYAAAHWGCAAPSFRLT
jgi:hypothetical protein